MEKFALNSNLHGFKVTTLLSITMNTLVSHQAKIKKSLIILLQIFLSSCLALATSQFVPFDPYTITEPTRPIWTGPLADHVNGIPPQDTPEVAAAKVHLDKAYSQVLAVLPVLPPEDRYRTQPNLVPQIPVHQHHHVQPQVVQPQAQVLQPQAQVVPQFTQFAEEIPRSPIGEVPEVAAARAAHLKAFQEAQAALPPVRN